MESKNKTNLATVFKSSNPALFALAKSILQAAGIPFMARGENIVGLFGWLNIDKCYNPEREGAEIMVMPEDSEDAKNLLKQLSEKEEVT